MNGGAGEKEEDMMRVMVVDDEPLILTLIDRVMRGAGHDVVVFEKGDEAMKAAKVDRFDLAIVDYDLPGVNGLAVLRELKELQPRCLRILASGALELQVIVEAVNGGDVAQVIEKPFQPSDLLSAIEAASQARERGHRAWLVGQEERSQTEVSMLSQSLDEDLLALALQPIMNGENRQPFAYEGLLRSKHPVLATPLAILEVAERHDMMRPVTESVVRNAREWLTRMPDPVKLFVNLHPSDFSDPDYLATLVQPLSPWSSRVVFEITERKSIRDFEAWRISLGVLKALGFDLAVDDLGAGYNSLGVLAEVKPSYIKIDMSIVRDVHQDSHKQRLVEVICRFAASTGARVIAEGVEVEYEAFVLQRAGVGLLQGYLLGRPEFELWSDSRDRQRGHEGPGRSGNAMAV